MFVIANSIAYIGTSLHGAITASSYNVPHSVLLKSAKKARFFIDTWKTSGKVYLANTQDLYDFVRHCDIEKDYMLNKNNISRAKDLVKSYYGRMIEEIGKERTLKS